MTTRVGLSLAHTMRFALASVLSAALLAACASTDHRGLLKSLGETVIAFGDLPSDASAIAGGKGASLGRMANAGLPVPPGFVVAADAFREFLESCGGTAVITRLAEETGGKVFPFRARSVRPFWQRTRNSPTAISWRCVRARLQKTDIRQALPASRRAI